MDKIPVYFMPGLAASTSIFERIELPEDQFEIFLLEWIIPYPKESLTAYVTRLSKNIQHKNPVLIGVSFGGVIVQEMAMIIPVQKTIIISSVKSNKEFPRRLKIAKSTKVYKLLPTGLVQNVEALTKFAYGDAVKQRLKLYDRYLCVRDKCYLDWAIETIILWDRTEPDSTIVHIHGDADDVFPIKYIKNSIVVKGGTHIMILNKFKWFNENLPKIILNTS
ncbi:alpha/beta fold hydrolase [Flavobacterium lacus]|uniref:Pimeloyl-ACP methyl ester carboxylesterase n=1 Tax=Flavobacterium lacus TaxID=1353778 RepID=A0A328WPP3_9FLAO|nr:alpha/beta hydrolase [Flavobacterium lacus]RAR47126.1 pimeloyl-ACP methyl ester carboxylesterase [Flavobacterium lacus]